MLPTASSHGLPLRSAWELEEVTVPTPRRRPRPTPADLDGDATVEISPPRLIRVIRDESTVKRLERQVRVQWVVVAALGLALALASVAAWRGLSRAASLPPATSAAAVSALAAAEVAGGRLARAVAEPRSAAVEPTPSQEPPAAAPAPPAPARSRRARASASRPATDPAPLQVAAASRELSPVDEPGF